MTVLQKPYHRNPPVSTEPSASSDEMVEPTPHRWTADDVLKMVQAGILLEGRGCELIDGELLDMAPQDNPHAIAVTRAARLFLTAFDESWWVTIQSTVRLPSGDLPEPDLALRPGPPSTDPNFNPVPLLVVEVSDSTLLFDQIVKSGLYAACGIQDYWIINLRSNQIEVYQNPVADAGRRHGFRYATLNTFAKGEKVSPLANAAVAFDVGRMLP